MVIFFSSCNDAGNNIILPVLKTMSVSEISQNNAKCSSSIVTSGTDPIIAKGICWSTFSLPTVKNDTTLDGSGSADFVNELKYLSAASTYYVRSYAKTATQTVYGKVVQLTTPPDIGTPNTILNPDLTYGTLTDVDGNVYSTIKIGNQTWMAENLRTTKYRNAELIPEVTDNAKWMNLSTGAQCVYNNLAEANNTKKFGRFYNYYAVSDVRNIAPQGWHVPTTNDWNVLINYLNSNLGVSLSVAQSLAAKTDWMESYTNTAIGCVDANTFTSVNNSSGFSALPSGLRREMGDFDYVSSYCAFWCNEQNNTQTAFFKSLNYYDTKVGSNTYLKQYGLSVRCIKD